MSSLCHDIWVWDNRVNFHMSRWLRVGFEGVCCNGQQSRFCLSLLLRQRSWFCMSWQPLPSVGFALACCSGQQLSWFHVILLLEGTELVLQECIARGKSLNNRVGLV